MKKQFFYLALAAIMCTLGVACSSDDDDKEVKTEPVSLTTPPYADEALEINLATELKTATDGKDIGLKSINLCESSKILLEMSNTSDGTTLYVMEDATISNNVYTMNGSKVKGTIKVQANGARTTRAATAVEINIAVKLNNGETVAFTTDGGSNADATTTYPPANDEATSHLARTWNVLGAILDLKSDKKNIKAYEEFDSRNGLFYLEDVLTEALDQGVNLTEEEQQEFKRVVKSVTFTKTGLFIISYVDGTEDVAEWSWANSAKTEISIRMKDEEMGNKFISDTTKLTVAYNGNRCNLKAETELSDKDNNDWESVLVLRLQE